MTLKTREQKEKRERERREDKVHARNTDTPTVHTKEELFLRRRYELLRCRQRPQPFAGSILLRGVRGGAVG